MTDYFNLPPKEESNLEKKLKKAASLALAGSVLVPASLGILSQNSFAQTQETKKKAEATTQKKDYTIYPLDVWVGEEHMKLRHGDSIDVPFDQTVYIKPQSKHGLTTEVMLKFPEKNIQLNDKYYSDNRGYITHSTGPLKNQRVIVIDDRIDLAEYGIRAEEEITAEPTYETKTKLFQTVQIKIRRGPQPIPETPVVEQPMKQWPSRLQPTKKEKKRKETRETKSPSIYEVKALFIAGSEPPVTKCDVEKDFSGFLVQGAIYKPNLRAWAALMNIGYQQKLKDNFTQGSVGVDVAAGPFVVELEGIATSNYKTGFISGGLRFPFGEKGYTGPVFVQATYGVGFGEGNRSDHPGDEPVHMNVKEKNFISVHVKSPFIEGHYSQSTYDNDLKTLHGKRDSFGITGMLPLNKLSKELEGLSLTAYYGLTHINESWIKDFEIQRYGVGLTYRK